MACRIVAILMTLSNLQSHSPNEGFLKMIFKNIYATVDNIACHVVTLW